MAVATATVTVNDEGVVTGLRTMGTAFREVSDSAEQAGEGIEQAEEAAASATSRFERFDESVQEAVSVTQRLENQQQQLAQGGREVIQALDRQADATRQIQRQTSTLNTTSANYNEIVFEAGALTQDLQFGIRGAANNIAFMAEMMAMNAKRAGGFMNMMKGVGSAIMGPAGVILGLQTLLALGPQIAEWFQSREEEASDLKKQLEEAASSMLSFRNEVAGFEVESLEQAKEVRDTIERRLKLNRQLVDLKDEISARGVKPEDVASLLLLIQKRTEEELTTAELRERAKEFTVERLEALQEQIPVQEAALKRAENMVTARKAQRDLQEVISRTQAEREDKQEETTVETLNTAEAMREVHRIQNEVIEQTEEVDLSEDLEIDRSKMVDSLSDARKALEDDFIRSIGEANDVIAFLEERLKEATSDQQRERIRGLIQAFRGLKNEMTDTSSEVDSFQDAFESIDKQRILAQALTDNFMRFAEAVGQGENVMLSFGKSALSVLASVGTAMGKQLIAQGSALVASALIPGLQGNAAAGAKLIAAGSTLVAASQALTGAISAGGEGAGGGEGDGIEGGATSETDVEIPGRRRGGPVEAGRVYETHGLGRREFFMPSMDGRVLTAGQLRTATTRDRNVNVRTEVDSSIGVEDARVDFDIGELRFRLNELETKINQVT